MSADSWTGRAGFLLATIGSAVGIGSIWKFPYEVGANGGSAFLLFYLLGLADVVVPLMFAEFAIGRGGRGDALTSIATLARRCGADPRWRFAGAFGVLTGFLILSFYSVIGGWTIVYALDATLRGLPGPDPAAVQARFAAFLADPWTMLACDAVFVACAAWIVARGVIAGIEKASRLLMPALFALVIALAVYAMLTGDVRATLRFLLTLDTDRLSARAIIEALGLGFFSIGVGLGLMITYGSYAKQDIDLVQVAIVSVLADTAISLLSGFAVFPIVFAHGLDPTGGPGLVFVTLPLAFARMPLGRIAAGAFFLLLAVAALASAISMLELVVALLSRWRRWSRRRATLLAASTCLVASVPTVLSFNAAAGWHPLGSVPAFADATFYDLIDELTSNVMLPLGGLSIAVFAGWVLPPRLLGTELRIGPRWLGALRFTLRWLAPGGVAVAALLPLFAHAPG